MPRVVTGAPDSDFESPTLIDVPLGDDVDLSQ